MKQKLKTKKAMSEIGVAVFALALLLVLGSVFVDDGQTSKSDYIKNKKNQNSQTDSNYLFYLNNTDLGRQNKVTESFPNIELGSKVENNIIFMGNPVKIKSNPFSKTFYEFDLDIENPQNLNSLMFYYTPDRITGKQDLIVTINGKTYYKNQGTAKDSPILALLKLRENQTKLHVTFELEKPRFYQLFNWNSYEISDLKVIAQTQDRSNNQKTFNFEMDKQFLERTELNIVIDCKNNDAEKPIKATINGYIIADFNPDCDKYTNTVTREIPLNILKSTNNSVKFESEGYYKMAYAINKIYYNEQFTYKFNINSFNDVIDVVIYGTFDKEVIDVRLNGQTFSLERDEIVSIMPYLRFGTNELKILTKPVEIEELIIEKNDYYTY